MVDPEQENVVAGKSILKRRVRNDGRRTEGAAAMPAAERVGDDECANGACCKRYVTFDDTITVKTDKDLVVKKPLKFELVIDNWKSKTEPDEIQPSPGIVRRLVDEFNTIEDTLIENPGNDHTLLEENNVKDDEPIREIQKHVPPLCESLETVHLTTTDD